ncbi:MAG: hypothetical protein IPO83_15155 [Chitinophagaceae bacterium]|nr:hypothetical protein [Chitinophagaceae bacterium]
MKYQLLTGAFVLTMLASCLNPPEYPVEPLIAFDSISKTFVKGQPAFDSITFVISFTDGDGDLGASSSDTIPNLFFKDSRTGFINTFQFPNITPEGNVKDISGTISYVFSPFNCTPGKLTDTFFYTIFISDRAGNMSNEVTTPLIICDCH